jgi:ribosomal protein S18 acetylase RimI-like enzyme
MLRHRPATADDAPLLAELNHQLIHDEGHRNRMTVPELEARMKDWLATDYRAVLFTKKAEVVAYALYRPEGTSAYLRQFFVSRQHRRSGIGRMAIRILLGDMFESFDRVYLDVLITNASGHAFWRAVGFQDYALTMESLRSSSIPGAVAS